MSWWIQNAVVAALLAAGALAGTRLARPRPAVQHLLWLVVLVKLVAPPVASWPGTVTGRAPVALALAPVRAVAAAAPGAATLPEAVREAGLRPGRTRDLLSVAWGAGAAVVVLLFLLRWRALRAALRAADPAPARLRREVERWAARLGTRPPRVLVARGSAATPFVWGVLRPRLVVPADLDRLDPGAVAGVVVHELAHLKRRDLAVGWLELAATALFWWNPVLWLVRRRLRWTAELACDAWVSAEVPSARRAYARALVDLARRTVPVAAGAAALTRRSTGFRAFRARLEAILDEPRPKPRTGPGPVVGAALALALVLPGWSRRFEGAGAETGVRSPTIGVIARGPASLGEDGEPVLGPGAWVLAFAGGSGGADRVAEVERMEDGALRRRWVVDGEERPWGPAARTWLEATLAGAGKAPLPADRPVARSWASVPRGAHAIRVHGEEALAAWTDGDRLWVVQQDRPGSGLRFVAASRVDGSWIPRDYSVDARESAPDPGWFARVVSRLRSDPGFGPRLRSR